MKKETESQAGRMTRGRAPGPRLHGELKPEKPPCSHASRGQGGRKGETVTQEKADRGHGRTWGFASNETRSTD